MYENAKMILVATIPGREGGKGEQWRGRIQV
jgi:hypothetical protein